MSDKIELQHTEYFLEALAALAVRTMKNLEDDGKISFFEGISYLQDFGILKKAFSGLKNLPNELKDLNDTEIDFIRNKIYNALNATNTDHALTVRIDASIVFIKAAFDYFMVLKNPAPKAELVEPKSSGKIISKPKSKKG